jgi:hypothetical protein
MSDKPVGKLVFDHIEDKFNTHAVYVDIFYRDEENTLWKIHTSSFLFDFKKVMEELKR